MIYEFMIYEFDTYLKFYRVLLCFDYINKITYLGKFTRFAPIPKPAP